MLVRQIALVSQTSKVSASGLSRVSAALQKQATRDLAPIWDVKATVDSFSRLSDVPIGYWPIIITEQNLGSAAGLHEDKQGQPFALVRYSYGWSLTASHELCEMLVDPFGNRLMAGQSPMKGQGRVEFLVEVCDPSEDTAFAYRVNGILVSDFYTPDFFAPTAAPSVRYSFTGAIKAPRQILKSGYISWHDPVSDHWYQQTFFSGAKPSFKDLGQLTAKPNENLRALLYRHTPERITAKDTPLKGAIATAAKASMKAQSKAGNAKAKSLESRIREVIEQGSLTTQDSGRRGG
jgi:hypothetical protein